MRVIIAGGRDFVPKLRHWLMLDDLHEQIQITRVICGMARGADLFGRNWAISVGMPVSEFPADWNKYGKSAGYLRNVQMAENADAVVLFAGGKGTQHMANIAREKGLKIYDWRDK